MEIKSHSEELHDCSVRLIYQGYYVKQMKWEGPVTCKKEMRSVELCWKPNRKIPHGRWEDNIKMDFREMFLLVRKG
jgi:hypothetical protein